MKRYDEKLEKKYYVYETCKFALLLTLYQPQTWIHAFLKRITPPTGASFEFMCYIFN